MFSLDWRLTAVCLLAFVLIVAVDPNMLNQFQSTMPQVKEQMKAAGKDPVLLVPPQLRPLLARYARLFAPGLHVLSYNEVPDELELKIMGALS